MNYHCRLAVGGADIGNQHRKKPISAASWHHRPGRLCIWRPALTTALAGVGVIEDPAQAETLQAQLRPGQAITSKDGSLWRWDGFVRLASKAIRAPNGSVNANVLTNCKANSTSSKKLKKTNQAQQTQDTLPNVKQITRVPGGQPCG